MKALLETVGEMIWPKPNKWYSPEWKRSDYVAATVAALIIATIIALLPP